MNKRLKKMGWLVMVLLAMALLMSPVIAGAVVHGVTGTTFFLEAKDGWISMADGTTAYIWGYAADNPHESFCPAGGCVQYVGPTLIVPQGQTVTVHLKNNIPTISGNTPVNTSIIFPGQNVVASGGVGGLLTREATPGGGSVTYTFTPSNAGTYTYYSGTQPELQVEMGLVGTLIVRPNNVGTANCPTPPALPFAPHNGYAYCVKNAYFDREYLFVTTEMDPVIHQQVVSGQMALVDNTTRHPTAWFYNGRNFPDTVSPDYAGWLPTQPYSTAPLEHPLESVLIRLVGGGRNLHPHHTHGQNHNVIARDGRLLQSGLRPDLADLPVSDYTTTAVAGETVDEIWGPYTAKYLNWDIFGDPVANPHVCDSATAGPLGALVSFLAANQPNLGINPAAGFDLTTGEWCPDHGKAIPVALPHTSRLDFGAMWGGTPFIGIPGYIPPIDPATGFFHEFLNPMAGVSFMWHSHSERELTTNNVFIGGLATMDMVMPYSVNLTAY